jgi:branched-chain amino acid transport system substrate-binding protein
MRFFGCLRVAIAVAAIALLTTTAWATCPSKIGLILPLTGPIAPIAQGMEKAAELAADQINAAGGANGCPVALVIRDSQGQPSVAVDDARQLLDLEGARVVVGGALSGTALAILNSVTAPAGVPLISPTASSPGFSAIGAKTGLFFRLNISDALQGIAAAKDAIKEHSGTVGIMAVNNDWGQNLSRVFSESYAKLGGKVGKVVLFNPGQSSYRAEVTSLLETKPDTLYMIGYLAEGSRIVRDWISLGGTQRMLFAHSLNDAKFVSAVGAQYLSKATWLTPGETASDSLSSFRVAFSAKYHEGAEGPGRANTYDAVMVASLAIQAAHSATDPKAIAAAIHKVTTPGATVVTASAEGIKAGLADAGAGKPINYMGAVGPVEFDQSGDIVGAFVIWKLDASGKLTIVDRMSAKDVASLRDTPASK